MHVVHLVQRYPRLSQTFVSNEVAELRRQGVDVTVVSLFPGDVPSDAIVLSESYEGVREQLPWRMRSLKRRLRSEMGAQDDQVEWWKLPALARDLGHVDVVHAHFAWNGAAAAMLLSRLVDAPWSVTLHANDIFGRLRNLDAKLRDANELVTVCQYNERWLREHHGLKRPLTQVVCGVELPPDVAHAKDVDVVAVGRLVAKKGFDVLLDAAAKLRVERPSLSVEIVGDGALRDSLQAQAAALGLDDVVRFRGALPHEETLERIAAGRVFCLPCRIADGGDRDSMPVVIKEAMARRVPVVASDVVAVPEMVDDACGALVPPDDAGALAAALARVLDEPGSLGDNGRARVEERFTLAGEVAKLRAMFAGMAAR